MLHCVECDLHYDVIWNNDGMEPPTQFCPRCGETDVVPDPEDDDTADRQD